MSDPKLRRAVQSKFETKQDIPFKMPGLLGDGNGTVETGTDNRVYVRINDMVTTAICDAIPHAYDLPVMVGYSIYQPGVLRVLEIREVNSTADFQGRIGAHWWTHMYQGPGAGGGTDVVWIDFRQIWPLRPYASSSLEDFEVGIMPGIVWIDNAPVMIGSYDGETAQYTPETVDLEDYIVATADKAKIMLITVDNTGAVVVTEGSEVDLSALDWMSDIPAIPASTRYVIAAVRLWYGQTNIVEHRDNPDLIDLRFVMWHSHDGGELGLSIEDIADVVITSVADGQVLVYDDGTSTWINQTLAEAGIAADDHDHDTDYAPLSHVSDTDNPHSVTLAQLGYTGKYTQYLHAVSSSDFVFLIDGDGNPITADFTME